MIAISEDSQFHPKNASKKFAFKIDRDWFEKDRNGGTALDLALSMCPNNPDDFDGATWLIISDENGKYKDHPDWARSGYVAMQENEIWVYVPAESILTDEEFKELKSDYLSRLKSQYASFHSEGHMYVETKVLSACFPEHAEMLIKAFMGFAHAALLEWVEAEDEEDEDEFPYTD